MISLPGVRTPRCSASQMSAAPMRHLTEYAGLRPSILARTKASEPLTKRFSLTSGVLPIDSALSSAQRNAVSVMIPPAQRQSCPCERVLDARRNLAHHFGSSKPNSVLLDATDVPSVSRG